MRERASYGAGAERSVPVNHSLTKGRSFTMCWAAQVPVQEELADDRGAGERVPGG